jgi:hypothetical protein
MYRNIWSHHLARRKSIHIPQAVEKFNFLTYWNRYQCWYLLLLRFNMNLLLSACGYTRRIHLKIIFRVLSVVFKPVVRPILVSNSWHVKYSLVKNRCWPRELSSFSACIRINATNSVYFSHILNITILHIKRIYLCILHIKYIYFSKKYLTKYYS